jgi:2-oxoglutarate dehydrogenase E2 component (dihydrolipoamide succinyltransferase)
VGKSEPLFVLETDKVTLEIEAEADGVLSIRVSEGETVAIGTVVGTIDTAAAPKVVEKPVPEEVTEIAPAAPPPEPPTIEPVLEIPLAAKPVLAPSVRRLVAEKNLDVSKIAGTGHNAEAHEPDQAADRHPSVGG